jgi:hypothetical protein
MEKETEKISKIKKSNILKKLHRIQTELKVPKNQYNSFGNYSYRNTDDILDSLKPFLKSENCILLLSDEIKNVGTHNYIESTAKIIDIESGESEKCCASAREAEIQKGMADSQISGATSSYARKCALGGLFVLDDIKDADSTNKTEKPQNQTLQTTSGMIHKEEKPKYEMPDYRTEIGMQCPKCKKGIIEEKWSEKKQKHYPKCSNWKECSYPFKEKSTEKTNDDIIKEMGF